MAFHNLLDLTSTVFVNDNMQKVIKMFILLPLCQTILQMVVLVVYFLFTEAELPTLAILAASLPQLFFLGNLLS